VETPAARAAAVGLQQRPAWSTWARRVSTALWAMNFWANRSCAALVLALDVGQRALVARDLGLGLVDVGAVGAVVEREQQLARLDELAFLDVDLADGAGGLRMQVDGADRGHGAVGLLDHGTSRRCGATTLTTVGRLAALALGAAGAGCIAAPLSACAVMVQVPAAGAGDDHGGGDEKSKVIVFHSTPCAASAGGFVFMIAMRMT
jgi:hypothetical protein